MVRLFIGLGDEEIILANDVWLKALALNLIHAVNNDSTNAGNISRQFLTETDSLPQDVTKLPSFSKALVHHLSAVGEAKPAVLARILLPLLLNNPIRGEEKFPRPPQSTKYCQAIIEEPVNDSDTVYKFTGGLVLGMFFFLLYLFQKEKKKIIIIMNFYF